MQSVLAFECFCRSCLSISAPSLSNQPQILCEGAFLLPMLCTQVPSSLAPVCAFPLWPPTYPLIWVANTPLHPPDVNTQGVSAYLFSLAGETAPFSEVGEHRETPPWIACILCIYTALSSFLLSVCGAPILPQCWGEGGVQPCPCPWCVVVCFNGDFSLCSFFLCLCIPAAAYTCLRGALLAGGPLLAH